MVLIFPSASSIVFVYQKAAERRVSPSVQRRLEVIIAVFARLSANEDSIASVQVENDSGRRGVPNRHFLILHRR